MTQLEQFPQTLDLPAHLTDLQNAQRNLRLDYTSTKQEAFSQSVKNTIDAINVSNTPQSVYDTMLYLTGSINTLYIQGELVDLEGNIIGRKKKPQAHNDIGRSIITIFNKLEDVHGPNYSLLENHNLDINTARDTITTAVNDITKRVK